MEASFRSGRGSPRGPSEHAEVAFVRQSFPHSPQNFIAGGFSKSQLEHLSFSDEPHSPQNFMPLAFSKPQAGQSIGRCLQEIVLARGFAQERGSRRGARRWKERARRRRTALSLIGIARACELHVTDSPSSPESRVQCASSEDPPHRREREIVRRRECRNPLCYFVIGVREDASISVKAPPQEKEIQR